MILEGIIKIKSEEYQINASEMIKKASSYKATEALEKGLINGIISSEEDLKKALS